MNYLEARKQYWGSLEILRCLLKMQNSRNWLEKKYLEFQSKGFDTEISGVSFLYFLFVKVNFSKVKFLKKVSGLPLHRKAAAVAAAAAAAAIWHCHMALPYGLAIYVFAICHIWS